MKYSDDIFQLVKSLTKQEKAHFKRFAASFADEESGNYIKYFNELVSQNAKRTDYDEERIQRLNFSGKFLKNLSYHKNYLYSLILASATLYNRDKKNNISLNHYISQIQILEEKELYGQANKILKKAKKLAQDTDSFIDLVKLLSLEKSILNHTVSLEEYVEKNNLLTKEQERYIAKINNNLEIYRLYISMGALTKQSGTGFWRKEEIMKNYEDIMNSDIMKDESAPKSFYSNFMFKSIKMQYSIAKNDFEAARKYAEENVLLLEENCGRTENYHHKYIITLGNLLNMQVRTAGIEEMDKTVSKMKNLEKKFPGKIAANDKIYLFYLISVLMISRHLNCREPEKLKELVTETSNELSKYESRMPFQLRFIIYYFLGTSNFVISDFDKTIYWLGKIINSEKSAESEDYQSHSRIVNLLCYYEQKYFDSLEYVLKSTYHYLSKRKRIFKYENIILSYLRKSFRIKTERELYQMFDEMYYELKKIVNDPFEKNAFDTFNILYWLESKIKKIPLNEILKNAAISGSAR